MSGELKGACIFGQSGGPTAVINASAYGVLKTALESDAITNVYGAAHGIRGVLDDRLYDIAQEDPDELRLLLHTPSSELGSCRYKMADPDADDTDYRHRSLPRLCERRQVHSNLLHGSVQGLPCI